MYNIEALPSGASALADDVQRQEGLADAGAVQHGSAHLATTTTVVLICITITNTMLLLLLLMIFHVSVAPRTSCASGDTAGPKVGARKAASQGSAPPP